MSTSSAIAGYLTSVTTQPDGSVELNDVALDVFLQTLVAGVTGLPGALVRPRWQAEPPNIPDASTTWAAVGVQSITADIFATVQHRSTGEGFDVVYRNEELSVLATFYGPQARTAAEQLSIGLQVYQNLEQLMLQGYGLIEVQTAIAMPELVHERWLIRVDVPVRLRRAHQYTYAVLNLLSAMGSFTSTDGAAGSILVNAQTVRNLPLFVFDLPASGVLAGLDGGNW